MNSANPLPAPPCNRLGSALLWVLIACAAFQFPHPPEFGLDPSWRMGMNWFFQQKMQFGRDVVFNYGPLGFVMARTYSGLQFWSLLAWQLGQSALVATLFVAEGRRLGPVARFFFFAYGLLFGIIYIDALHMIIIALLGVQLLRRIDSADAEEPRGLWWPPLVLAVLALAKFTNFLFAGVAIACVAGLALARQRRAAAIAVAAWFGGGFLVGWVACGQNPLHLPAYVRNSWLISSGYNDTMGLVTPAAPLRLALGVAALLLIYWIHYLWLHPRKPAALAYLALLGAFMFLNWKHAFVRADGHMIGFFICALLPVVAYPRLTDDPPLRRWFGYGLLIPAGILSLAGIEAALPGVVQGAAEGLERSCWTLGEHLAHWTAYRERLDGQLRDKRQAASLPRVRATVGSASIDVLGFNQAYALLNELNYRPRPVIQSYSTFNPPLVELNAQYYGSARAPQYALLRLEAIDERLVTFDDSRLLNYFIHAYDYVLTEKDWQLWRRRPDAPTLADVAPQRLREVRLLPGEPLALDEFADRPLWLTIDWPPSISGRLLGFLYKPPQVRLKIEDRAGRVSVYRLPMGEAQAGFIINPLVETVGDYLNFAGGGPPARRVRRVTLQIAPEDRKFFGPAARAGVYALVPSTAGVRFHEAAEREQFWMFKTCPTRYKAFALPSEATISGRVALVMHAPSEMEFAVPAGATSVSGSFGFAPGAYVGEARTNGADFRVIWVDGAREELLFHRLLDPRGVPGDRGLQEFHIALGAHTGGKLRLVADPGPNNDNGWDWTAWSEIEIR